MRFWASRERRKRYNHISALEADLAKAIESGNARIAAELRIEMLDGLLALAVAADDRERGLALITEIAKAKADLQALDAQESAELKQIAERSLTRMGVIGRQEN
ncbi:MAG: hypothetical protein ACRD8A_14610 [Candidatus Acidiferrales bacterium]